MDSAGPSSNSSKSSDPIGDEPDLSAAEDRARQAFGLTSSPEGIEHRSTAQITRAQLAGRSSEDRQRTHFVRDGEVPVVYLPGSASSAAALTRGSSRLAAAETALESERQARQQAERALTGAQSALHEAQTRLGHANLARAEADETLQKFRTENDELKAQLELARAALQKAEVPSGRTRGSHSSRPDGEDREDNGDTAGINAPRKTGEPKPVRWW